MSEKVACEEIACGECGLTMAESITLDALKHGQGEPVAIVYVREEKTPSEHGRFTSWLINPSGIHNGTKLYTSATTIPEGYVLVPVEPTDEMIYMMTRATANREERVNSYQAMIAAAPKQGETA